MHWLNTKSAARPAGDKAFGNQLLVGQLNGSGADMQLSGQAADGRQACIRRQCAAENLFFEIVIQLYVVRELPVIAKHGVYQHPFLPSVLCNLPVLYIL
ncbi:hypothetical protein D3C76_1689800 [compost metagenome]